MHNKSVFEYENYREFLKDAYIRLKEQDKKYSFRYFSQVAGFKSSSVLKMIMDGKRNMSSRSIEQFSKALKLGPEEAAFFQILVLFNQAKTGTEKQGFAQALLNFKEFKKSNPLTESQYNFCAFWYMPVIWEFSGVPGFKDDPEWVAKRIIPNITVSQAKKALSDLEQLGLLVPSPKGGRVKSQMNVRTTNEVASSAIAQWHREMMKRAAESIERFPREKRDISSITCSVSEPMAKRFKEKVQKFRKELMDMASQDPSPKMVYQLNLQLFPIADIEGEDSE